MIESRVAGCGIGRFVHGRRRGYVLIPFGDAGLGDQDLAIADQPYAVAFGDSERGPEWWRAA
jgi:hypothetical protein